MKRFNRILMGLLALELIAAGIAIVVWWQDPVPPQPDLSHYHPATAEPIQTLQQKTLKNGNAENWFQLGKLYLLIGLFPEAEYACRHAAELDPESFAAFFWWGVALHQLGETEAAIRRFREAIPLAGNQKEDSDGRARCWYAIGRNHLRRNNAAEAEKAFREAGDFLPARHQLARIRLRTERAADAVPLLETLIAKYPNESEFHQLLAAAKRQLGDGDAAQESSARVEHAPKRLPTDFLIFRLQLDANHIGLKAKLESCRRQFDRNQAEAIVCLQELLAADWKSGIADMLANAQLRVGNAHQSNALVTKLMARDGVSAKLLQRLADGYAMLGQDDRAFAVRKRAATLRHFVRLHEHLAKHYDTRGKHQLAERHAALAKQTAGIAAFRNNDLVEARRTLEAAVKRKNALPDAWYFLGECRLAGKDRQQAIAAYRKCLAANPNHGRAIRRLQWLTAGRK